MADNSAESELDSFRKQWQEEVSRRANRKDQLLGGSSRGPMKGTSSGKQPLVAPPSTSEYAAKDDAAQADSFEGYSLNDLESKEEGLKLGASQEARQAALGSDPQTALEHYEKAVEKEGIGNLGDSISLYRKAFKLDDGVHEAYKQKHFAASWKKPSAGSTSTATGTPASGAKLETTTTPAPASIKELVASFAGVSIQATAPETNLSEPQPCPISEIPLEILEGVMEAVACQDPATLARLAPVCKRLAHLTMTSQPLWKSVVWSRTHGVAAMPYRYLCDLTGAPLQDGMPVRLAAVPDLTPAPYASYRAQFRHRPRLRFGGCYISTVNYTRPGGHSLSHYGEDGRPSRHAAAWTSASPVHIVTYYRYLRFYRDGTVVSLLTTSEPADVVNVLAKEHVLEQPALKPGGKERVKHRHAPHDHGAASASASTSAASSSAHGQPSLLPQNVMKEALLGRWRLSGPASGPAPTLDDGESSNDNANDNGTGASTRPGEYAKEPVSAAAAPGEDEEEGVLHIETQGVVPKYMWKMAFGVGTAGRKDGSGTRNNKLSWRGFWSYNRLTDDWGEFGLKNDRPFYWSRVRSYGIGG